MNVSTLRNGLRNLTIIGLVTLVLLELTVRAFFAIKVGPDVLLYGTPYCCGTNVNLEKPAATPESFAQLKGYTTYHPNQKRRDLDENGLLFDVAINRHGFRGEDFETEKGRDVIRVATLGASSTFGFHDRDDETYPVMLQRKLNRAAATMHGCRGLARFEVINLGIPHLKSDNILSLYRAEGRPLRPDIVTFYEGVNDAANGIYALQWEKTPYYYRAVFKLKRWLVTSAVLGTIVDAGEPRFRHDDLVRLVGDKPAEFIKNLRAIRELVLQDGALFIVATQQVKAYRYAREVMQDVTYEREVAEAQRELETSGAVDKNSLILLAHSRLMDALRAWSQAESVPLVDAIARLNQRRDLLASWVHLNGPGNDMLSDAFSERITELYCGRPGP